MNQKDERPTEIEKLRTRIATLEQNELKLIIAEKKLQAANQQLDASNQQLQASEQQLRALNDQLKANELELRKKESLANEARDYAENIISTVRESLLILDGDLRVVSASQFFYTTFKVTPKDTEGKLLYKLGNNQWNIPSLKKLLNNILPKKIVVENYEIEHTFEQIGKKTMLLNARELQQNKDKKRRIFLSIQDITERRQAEQNLTDLNSELEAKTEELQQILYITTHDLRSPLVNIQGFNKELSASLNELSGLLENEKISETVKEKLSFILDEDLPEAMHFITSSTNKMDALLTGLLSLSRLGRQKSVFKDVNMNQLMKDVVNNFGFEINKKKIVLNVSDLPSCRGDEFQLNQLFSNLVGNSLKFIEPERKTIIKITGEKENGYLKYAVEDNGIGIHPDHQKKVFELFHKLDPQKPGIGLGMNIVKQIVEKHKGRVELQSVNNVGTKFIIFIPV